MGNNEVEEWGKKEGYEVKKRPRIVRIKEVLRAGAQKSVKAAKSIDKAHRKYIKPAIRTTTKRMAGSQKSVSHHVETASPFARSILGYSPTRPKKTKGKGTIINVYVGGQRAKTSIGRKKKKREHKRDPFGIGSIF